jgi:hypothetical protein
VIRFSDSLGRAVREVVFDADPAKLAAGATVGPPPGASASDSVVMWRLGGTWDGRRIEVVHKNLRGLLVSERYELKDNGRTLEVRVQVEADGDRPAMELKRVYRRVDQP